MFQNGTTLPMDDFTGMFRALLEEAPGERRAARRRRMLKTATLRYHRGLIAREATVRDMTETGARIGIADAHLLPATFRFDLSGEAASRTARVVWAVRGEAGVSFA